MENKKTMLHAIRNRLEYYKKEIAFSAIIFLASSLSFALGYTANREYSHAPIVIEKCSGAE